MGAWRAAAFGAVCCRKKDEKSRLAYTVRLDPMIPYPNWKKGYGEAIRRINALSPEMVTLGSLRATFLQRFAKCIEGERADESIFDYLTEEKDPSGFKYRLPFAKQVEMFRFAVGQLKQISNPRCAKKIAPSGKLWVCILTAVTACWAVMTAS